MNVLSIIYSGALVKRVVGWGDMAQKPVTIYTTKTCGFCRATKSFFAENNIAYTEVDVGADPVRAREMIEKSGQMGVPVTVIGEADDEQIIVGFDKARLSQMLGVNG
jgi:glutaredoxin-like YruB-family protein